MCWVTFVVKLIRLIVIIISTMRKNIKKGPSYLDVAEYILTGPFSPHISPAVKAIEPEPVEVPTFSTTSFHTLLSE